MECIFMLLTWKSAIVIQQYFLSKIKIPPNLIKPRNKYTISEVDIKWRLNLWQEQDKTWTFGQKSQHTQMGVHEHLGKLITKQRCQKSGIAQIKNTQYFKPKLLMQYGMHFYATDFGICNSNRQQYFLCKIKIPITKPVQEAFLILQIWKVEKSFHYCFF